MRNLIAFTFTLVITIVASFMAVVTASAINTNTNTGYSVLQKRTEVAHCYPNEGCQGTQISSIDYGTFFADGSCPYLVQEIAATRCNNCFQNVGCHTVHAGGCGPGGSGCFHPLG